MNEPRNPESVQPTPAAGARSCGTSQVHERLLRTVPGYAAARAEIETLHLRGGAGRATPVDAHRVHPASRSWCTWCTATTPRTSPTSRSHSQIAVLNADYRAYEPDTAICPGRVPPAWSAMPGSIRAGHRPIRTGTRPTASPGPRPPRLVRRRHRQREVGRHRWAPILAVRQVPEPLGVRRPGHRAGQRAAGLRAIPRRTRRRPTVWSSCNTGFGTTGHRDRSPFNLGRTRHPRGRPLAQPAPHLGRRRHRLLRVRTSSTTPPTRAAPTYGNPDLSARDLQQRAQRRPVHELHGLRRRRRHVHVHPGPGDRMQAALDGPRSTVGISGPCADSRAGPRPPMEGRTSPPRTTTGTTSDGGDARHTLNRAELRERAQHHLVALVGDPAARLRDDQWTAIEALVAGPSAGAGRPAHRLGQVRGLLRGHRTAARGRCRPDGDHLAAAGPDAQPDRGGRAGRHPGRHDQLGQRSRTGAPGPRPGPCRRDRRAAGLAGTVEQPRLPGRGAAPAGRVGRPGGGRRGALHLRLGARLPPRLPTHPHAAGRASGRHPGAGHHRHRQRQGDRGRRRAVGRHRAGRRRPGRRRPRRAGAAWVAGPRLAAPRSGPAAQPGGPARLAGPAPARSSPGSGIIYCLTVAATVRGGRSPAGQRVPRWRRTPARPIRPSGCRPSRTSWPTGSRRWWPPRRSGWASTSRISASSSTSARRRPRSPTTSRSAGPAAASTGPPCCCCPAGRTGTSGTTSGRWPFRHERDVRRHWPSSTAKARRSRCRRSSRGCRCAAAGWR